jgi:hypothetical protein
MNFDLKDMFYIIGILATGLSTFFATKYGLKEYVRDNLDSLRKENKEFEEKIQEQITSVKLDLKGLSSNYENQQQIIDQIYKNNNNLIDKLIEAVNKKEQVNG